MGRQILGILKLYQPQSQTRVLLNIIQTMSHTALITLDKNSYLYPVIITALKTRVKDLNIKDGVKDHDTNSKVFQYGDYEDLDFDRLMSDRNYLACSYVYRKGLIRKHYLANTIAVYVAKNPDSILKIAAPESYNLEVDYAEFLDDSLDEAYELRCILEENEDRDSEERSLFILKPSMSDRGQGIRLFQTIEELQNIFDSFDEPGTDDEDDENGITTSQLRHFIVQKYVQNVLLLPEHFNRKFHIRTYVVASGALKVFVFRDMLALFALSPYKPDNFTSLKGHLTNTCLQGEKKDENSVHLFWKLKGLSEESKNVIFDKLCSITGDLFKAALGGGSINFQPLPNAFEIYGLDFLVTEDLSVKLLEVNAYPDFGQTGDELKEIVIDGLFTGITEKIVGPFFGLDEVENQRMVEVLNTSVSGSW